MGAQLKETITLDTSKHDKGLRLATQSIGAYKKQVDGANKTLNGFLNSVNSATGSLGNMISAFKNGDIMGFASNAKNAGTALSGLIPIIGGTAGAVGGLGAAINVALGPVGLAVAAISGIVAVGVAAGKSVEEFNTSLKDLSALTGMAGSALQDIGDSALELSMKYGKSATSIVDSFKLIGSQAPQLLQDKEGLEAVTEAAMVLAKAAGIEVLDAAKGVTTVMNQLNVSASEAGGIINALAAGSKNGAGDVAYLQTAIEKAGTLAGAAGMSYQQLIGTIETLAPRFSSAEVAGTSLSGTLVRLTTLANDNFNPAIVGLDKALENLDKANLSAADKVKLFGQSNLAAANTLIENREALKDMTASVTDTNTAYELMATKGGSIAETWEKLKSSWDALMVAMGQSATIQIVITYIQNMIEGWTLIIQILYKVQKGWNEVTTVVSALVLKLWNDNIKPIWDNIRNAITDSAMFLAAAKLWNQLLDVVHKVLSLISKWWNDFKKWLGLEGNATISAKLEVKITDETSGGESGGTSSGATSGSSTKGTTTKKAPPKKGSLDDTEALISALQGQLKNTDTNDTETIEALKKQIADLLKVAKLQKIQLGLEVVTPDNPEGSLADIQDRLSKALGKLKLVDPSDVELIAELKKLIDDLTALEKQLKIALGLEQVKPEAVEGSLKQILALISKCKAIIEISAIDSPEYKEAIKQLQELTAKELQIKVKIETDGKTPEILSKEQAQIIKQANQDMYDGLKSSWGAATSLGDTIKELSEGFEDMDGWEIFESLGNTIFSVIDNVSTLCNAFGLFSSAMLAASAVQTATSAASAAASQTEASASLAKTTAKAGEAIAGATASGASLPFPANLAAIAAGVAAVVGVIATIASLAKFADGGIVGGNTTIGDYNLIRANKGEMILNGKQLASLFRLLDGGASNSGISGGEVKFKISGKELVGVLSNYNNKVSKVK